MVEWAGKVLSVSGLQVNFFCFRSMTRDRKDHKRNATAYG
jgi:hypothetical protein